MATQKYNVLSPQEKTELHKKIDERVPFAVHNDDDVLIELGMRISDVSMFSNKYDMLVCKNNTCWIRPRETGVVTFIPISPHNRDLARKGKRLSAIMIEEAPNLDTSVGNQ